MQDTTHAPSVSQWVAKQHEPTYIEKGILATRRAFLQNTRLGATAPSAHGCACGATPVTRQRAR